MLRTLVLLVFVFVLAACGGAPAPTPTPTATAVPATATPVPVWTDAEIAYLDSLAPLQLLPDAFMKALSKPGDGSMQVALRDALTQLSQLSNRPKAPAALAVIEGRVIYVQSACVTARDLDPAHINQCVTQLTTLTEELQRLYAERGAYPHE